MFYRAFGPFGLSRNNNQIVIPHHFWDEVDGAAPNMNINLRCAQGVYIFSMYNATPWYVGKTHNSFYVECFDPQHKISVLNNILERYPNGGSPSVHLLARQTPLGNFTQAGVASARDIGFLEKMLIGIALERNPNIENIRETVLLQQMVVPFLINNPPGNPGHAAQSVAAIMGLH